jgi:hypothetical protein
MEKFKGFCPKVEKEQATRIMRQRRKLFKKIVEDTGSVEIARKILSDRPHTKYIPNLGYVLMAEPDWTLPN